MNFHDNHNNKKYNKILFYLYIIIPRHMYRVRDMVVSLLVSVCVCVCVCSNHIRNFFVCFSSSFFYQHMQAVWAMDPNYKCIHLFRK